MNKIIKLIPVPIGAVLVILLLTVFLPVEKIDPNSSEDVDVVYSSTIFNVGIIEWVVSSYPPSDVGVIRVIDMDMNLEPEAIDGFDIDVWSDTDAGGISLRVTETDDSTGIFEGTVYFSNSDESSGSRLQVSRGDTITAEYEDNTLPSPYDKGDTLDITDYVGCFSFDSDGSDFENTENEGLCQLIKSDKTNLTMNDRKQSCREYGGIWDDVVLSCNDSRAACYVLNENFDYISIEIIQADEKYTYSFQMTRGCLFEESNPQQLKTNQGLYTDLTKQGGHSNRISGHHAQLACKATGIDCPPNPTYPVSMPSNIPDVNFYSVVKGEKYSFKLYDDRLFLKKPGTHYYSELTNWK